ncbi:uncharacterized protein LOC102292662 isoform X2 [Haplochromis burtoni]|uniref:uncharacterized protein LOC102292662 isoform X2 n=1 Tax=Haplochromis burtoni TaxID=8153 RepID=UPI001C2D8F78|nr:uncharacterized protein LOC102292662 isoform X2 [Haplochromis burtoni]
MFTVNRKKQAVCLRGLPWSCPFQRSGNLDLSHCEKLQLHLSLTELQRSDCTVTEAQDETMDGVSPASARCGPRCQHKPQRFRPRPMHQSTLSLGDTPPCYTTTHTQSYSGRSVDGRPLVFRLRDPSFPSQHRSQLDLRDNNMPPQSVLQSHSKEVYAPQHVTPLLLLSRESTQSWKTGLGITAAAPSESSSVIISIIHPSARAPTGRSTRPRSSTARHCRPAADRHSGTDTTS